MECSEFLHDVRVSPQVFWKKSSSHFFGPKVVKFFRFCRKFTLGIFLIFCMKLQRQKVLKLTYMIILGKILFWVFGLKLPKLEFLQFMENKFWELFYIFCIRLHQHESLKLIWISFSRKILILGFWAKRGPKV